VLDVPVVKRFANGGAFLRRVAGRRDDYEDGVHRFRHRALLGLVLAKMLQSGTFWKASRVHPGGST
jgi:hypothetical protein